MVVALACFIGTSQPAHALTFNINYESSVTSQSPTFVAAFQNAFNIATQSFQSVYNDPITITLNVGWGTVNGQTVTALGQALTVLSQPYTYSQIKTAFANDAANATDTTALASLGLIDPTNGGNFTIPKASAKALGLIANNSTVDGHIGFKSSASFTFDPNNRAVAGSYDFIGVAQHEISHVMGRIGLLGVTLGSVPNRYSTFDLFRYSGVGTRSMAGGQAAYFSIDGGLTNLGTFSTASGGDYESWISSGPADSFNAAVASGVLLPLSSSDLTVMDIIGYNGSFVPGPSLDRFNKNIPTVMDFNPAMQSEIPEPATLILLGSGFLALLTGRWMKRAGSRLTA